MIQGCWKNISGQNFPDYSKWWPESIWILEIYLLFTKFCNSILHYSTLFNNFRHNSTLYCYIYIKKQSTRHSWKIFGIFQQYSIFSENSLINTKHYSTLLHILRHYITSFDDIRHDRTIFSIFNNIHHFLKIPQYSPLFNIIQ